MKDLDKHTCRIALVQAEPVLFNKQESLKKALDHIKEAAKTKLNWIWIFRQHARWSMMQQDITQDRMYCSWSYQKDKDNEYETIHHRCIYK